MRRCYRLRSLLLVLCLQASGVMGEEQALRPALRATIREVTKIMENDHLKKQVLNNEVSRKWMQVFLARFDPQRMYFIESDLQEFSQYQDRTDECARNGDGLFPQLVRKRYRERTEEALAYATEWIDHVHDYAVSEECPIRNDDYADSCEELRERWQLRIKLELWEESRHGRSLLEVRQQFADRYRRISRQAEDMTDDRLCHIYIDSLSSVFDPHCAYYGPEYLGRFRSSSKKKTYGLGIAVRQSEGHFVIDLVHQRLGCAASQQKVVGWSLVGIQRLNGEFVDVVEMHTDDFMTLIRDPSSALKDDTEVILELLNPVTRRRVSMSWDRIPSF